MNKKNEVQSGYILDMIKYKEQIKKYNLIVNKIKG